MYQNTLRGSRIAPETFESLFRVRTPIFTLKSAKAIYSDMTPVFDALRGYDIVDTIYEHTPLITQEPTPLEKRSEPRTAILMRDRMAV